MQKIILEDMHWQKICGILEARASALDQLGKNKRKVMRPSERAMVLADAAMTKEAHAALLKAERIE